MFTCAPVSSSSSSSSSPFLFGNGVNHSHSSRFLVHEKAESVKHKKHSTTKTLSSSSSSSSSFPFLSPLTLPKTAWSCSQKEQEQKEKEKQEEEEEEEDCNSKKTKKTRTETIFVINPKPKKLKPQDDLQHSESLASDNACVRGVHPNTVNQPTLLQRMNSESVSSSSSSSPLPPPPPPCSPLPSSFSSSSSSSMPTRSTTSFDSPALSLLLQQTQIDTQALSPSPIFIESTTFWECNAQEQIDWNPILKVGTLLSYPVHLKKCLLQRSEKIRKASHSLYTEARRICSPSQLADHLFTHIQSKASHKPIDFQSSQFFQLYPTQDGQMSILFPGPFHTIARFDRRSFTQAVCHASVSKKRMSWLLLYINLSQFDIGRYHYFSLKRLYLDCPDSEERHFKVFKKELLHVFRQEVDKLDLILNIRRNPSAAECIEEITNFLQYAPAELSSVYFLVALASCLGTGAYQFSQIIFCKEEKEEDSSSSASSKMHPVHPALNLVSSFRSLAPSHSAPTPTSTDKPSLPLPLKTSFSTLSKSLSAGSPSGLGMKRKRDFCN